MTIVAKSYGKEILRKSSSSLQAVLDGLVDSGLGVSGEDKVYYDPPFPVENLARLRKLSIPHNACVQAKAIDIAGLGIDIVASDEEGILHNDSKKKVRKWLRRLHKRKSLSTLLAGMVADRESLGWGCLEVIRNNAGKVTRLEPLPAKNIRIVKKRDLNNSTKYVQIDGHGQAKMYFQEFPDKYEEDGTPNFISKRDGKKSVKNVGSAANEIIFFNKESSENVHYGTPDIIPGLPEVQMDQSITSHNTKFFENHCMGRWAVFIKGGTLDENFEQTIEEYFQQHIKNEPHKTLVISSDDEDIQVDFKKLDAEYKELDFLETKKELRDAIFLAHGFPPVLLGVTGDVDAGSDEGMSQAELYTNRVIKPPQSDLHEILDDLVEESPVKEEGATLRIVKPDIRSILAQARALAIYTSHGLQTQNEARSAIGLPRSEDPGANKLMIWSRGSSPHSSGETQESENNDSTNSQEADNPQDEPNEVLEEDNKTPRDGG